MSERRHHPGVCIYTSPSTICENRPYAGTPLCQGHLRKIILMGAESGGIAEALFGEPTRALHEYLDGADPARIATRERMAARRAALEAEAEARSVVYYVRIGSSVKIGYTAHLRQRMADLRIDDVGEALLAIEPGGRSVEAARHREFAQHRLGRRENFVPVPRLVAHIEDVRREHGDPSRHAAWVGSQTMIDKARSVRDHSIRLRSVAEGRSDS